MENETKKCPFCGEEILIEAKKCKHCGEWLEDVQRTDLQTSAEEKVTIEQIVEDYEEHKRKSSVIGGAIGGIASAIITTVLWCVITCETDFESGVYALGVGIIVGLSVRIVARGGDWAIGLIAALFSVLSCIASEIILSGIYYNIGIDFTSVLFWIIAAGEAYYFAHN